MTMSIPDPYALGRDGLAALLDDQPRYRADQVHRWLVRGVDDPADMTDLPRDLRERLTELLPPPPALLRSSSADGGLTRKVLLGFPAETLRTDAGSTAEASPRPPRVDAGSTAEASPRTLRTDVETRAAAEIAPRSPRTDVEAAEIAPRSPRTDVELESVLMCYPARDGKAGRATVCISTQAGCAMGCPFCATGQAGFRGQLSVGQVVRQVTVMQRLLAEGAVDVPGVPDHVTNVVFMGMGEPLANLDVTVAAVRWLHDPEGFNLSARSITVSTVGLVPGIRRLAELGLPITLAVSLHAPDDALRDDLVPVNRQHPLGELLSAARQYRDRTGRRLTFEYVLIDGINASVDQARRLAALLRGFGAHVNLIPMNTTPAVPWQAPPVPTQRAFLAVLKDAGVAATIRRNRGGDIDAACGQLYADYAMASGRTLPGAVGAAERLSPRQGAEQMAGVRPS
ncbi:MAG: 23S rRNA (adenine(2503)-C(2))-methyltransferase RlmN [Actinomycetota bacterium]|nr:23S rRNA (adenine(2503)-C(2))-methyltransferase RlmN [Actinomycetota bacterium]